MSEKKRTISEQADEIRRELDDLIGDGALDVESDPSDLPISAKPTDLAPLVNYTELKGTATKQDIGLMDAVNDTLQALEIIETNETFYKK